MTTGRHLQTRQGPYTRLEPTSLGVTIHQKIARGDCSYHSAGIDLSAWLYLGYLVNMHSLDTQDMRTRYGTLGEATFQKLVNLEYATLREVCDA